MEFLDKDVRAIRVGDNQADCCTPTAMDHLDSLSDPTSITNTLIDTRGRTSERKYKWMRLSEIDGACPREWVIGHVDDVVRFERVAFGNLCAMDMGSALHSWVQNSNVYFGNSIYGYWRCYACGNQRRFGVKPTNPCEFCKASPRATFYSEYMFRLASPFRVVGKMDLIIKVDKVFRIVEIKTTSKDLTHPDGGHVAQLASYMYFSQFHKGEDALPIEIDRSVGYLVYFTKTFNYRRPVLSFPVKPNEALISPLREKAQQFTEGINTGKLPDVLPECLGYLWNGGRAKTCVSAKKCQDFHSRHIQNLSERAA